MDLIAYIFNALYVSWPLLALALFCWVANACRNPVRSSYVYTLTPEQRREEDRKLKATIALTSGEDFGINVRRGHQ
jgi:hypothetical protein